ncbi:GNAT family N-acetyltransferase [Rhizobium binae]|uniref:GNAT family N-acetyltransferase n=1 Tax=Rhizobium binae TaxID=1138190 RepID=UPI001C836007|nr:GNAT family N-acetyltransferase [Rhizobium binae]MBX4952757.1 GNAT family N-acetyltransferase [Rhizobium binae]
MGDGVMNEMLFRKATKHDFGQISELFSEVDALHRTERPDLFKFPDREARPIEYFEQLLEPAGNCVIVAESQGTILGMIVLMERFPSDNPLLVARKLVDIDTLVVREHARGVGVGRSLIFEALKWAKAIGATHVESTVYTFNEAASKAFLNAGFEKSVCRFGIGVSQD